MSEMMFTLQCNLILMILSSGLIHTYVPKRNVKIYFMVFIHLLWFGIDAVISFLFYGNIFLLQMFLLIANSLFVTFLYQIHMFWAFLLVSLFHGCHLAMEFLIYTFYKTGFYFIQNSFLEQKLYILFLIKEFCHFILFYFIYRLQKGNLRNYGIFLRNINYLRFLIFPVFTIFVIMELDLNYIDYMNKKSCGFIISISGGLLIINYAIICILNDSLYQEAKMEEERMLKEKAEIDSKAFQLIHDQYMIQRKATHEFKNHISCLAALSRHSEYEKLEEYVGNLRNEISRDYCLFDLRHKLVNVIVNTKYQEAREKGILFILKANDLSYLKMRDQDIVVLISNLLNNAFEASEFCQKKEIKVKMFCENDQFIFSVQNRYVREPIRNGKRFISIKEQPQSHGVGMENAVDVINRYKGSYTVNYDENWFYFSAIIQNIAV